MASVLDSLTKKIEALSTTTTRWWDEEHVGHNGELLHKNYENIITSIGKIYLVESSSAKDSTDVSVVKIEDPRHYKDIFKLDTLGIEKSLKTVLLEVKDSILRLYYVLDSSCFYIDFDCSYQVLEGIQELPVEAISYFRILFSKKAPIEIKVYSGNLYIDFEDSVVKIKSLKTLLEEAPDTTVNELNQIIDTAQKKGQKKEKEIAKKYTLELPLKSINDLNFQVVELVEKVVSLEGYSVGKDIVGLPLNYDSIKTPNTKESVEYCGTTIRTDYGDFVVVCTSGLVTTTIICPSLIGKKTDNEYETKWLIPEDADVDYEENTEERIDLSAKLDNLIPVDDIFEESFMESDSD